MKPPSEIPQDSKTPCHLHDPFQPMLLFRGTHGCWQNSAKEKRDGLLLLARMSLIGDPSWFNSPKSHLPRSHQVMSMSCLVQVDTDIYPNILGLYCVKPYHICLAKSSHVNLGFMLALVLWRSASQTLQQHPSSGYPEERRERWCGFVLLLSHSAPQKNIEKQPSCYQKVGRDNTIPSGNLTYITMENYHIQWTNPL